MPVSKSNSIEIYIYISVYITAISERLMFNVKKGIQIFTQPFFSAPKKTPGEEFSLGNAFPPLGLPWEIGLAETHQTLVLNGLRRLGFADGRWDDGM